MVYALKYTNSLTHRQEPDDDGTEGQSVYPSTQFWMAASSFNWSWASLAKVSKVLKGKFGKVSDSA